MDDGSWPHSKKHRKTKTAHSEEIDHKVDPKGLGQAHLGEDAKGWNEQRNDDPKDVAAGHEQKHGSVLVLAITTSKLALTTTKT